MITPTKGIAPDRALLAVGARILTVLDVPRTVARAWALFGERDAERGAATGRHVPVTFERFVLALDLLYALGLVDLRRGELVAVRPGEGSDAA